MYFSSLPICVLCIQTEIALEASPKENSSKLNMEARQQVFPLLILFLNVILLSATALGTKVEEALEECGYTMCSSLSYYCDHVEGESVACESICHFRDYPSMQRHCEEVCPRYLEEQRTNNEAGATTTAGTAQLPKNCSHAVSEGIRGESHPQKTLIVLGSVFGIYVVCFLAIAGYCWVATSNRRHFHQQSSCFEVRFLQLFFVMSYRYVLHYTRSYM